MCHLASGLHYLILFATRYVFPIFARSAIYLIKLVKIGEEVIYVFPFVRFSLLLEFHHPSIFAACIDSPRNTIATCVNDILRILCVQSNVAKVRCNVSIMYRDIHTHTHTYTHIFSHSASCVPRDCAYVRNYMKSSASIIAR